MNIKENYQQYVSRYASEVAALKRKNTGFITGELLAFGGILAFLICYFALRASYWLLAASSPSWSAISHWMEKHRTI